MYFADFEHYRGFLKFSAIEVLPDVSVDCTKWISKFLRIFGYFLCFENDNCLICLQTAIVLKKRTSKKKIDEIIFVPNVKEMFWHFFFFFDKENKTCTKNPMQNTNILSMKSVYCPKLNKWEVRNKSTSSWQQSRCQNSKLAKCILIRILKVNWYLVL